MLGRRLEDGSGVGTAKTAKTEEEEERKKEKDSGTFHPANSPKVFTSCLEITPLDMLKTDRPLVHGK